MTKVIPAAATAGLAATLGAALSIPPLRSLIEQSMTWHMVVQMPLLVLAGALAARAVVQRTSETITQTKGKANKYGAAQLTLPKLAGFNHFGLTGFMAAQGITAYWMLPSAIDRAVVNPGFDALKLLTLFISGALLHGAFRRAPVALQLFFMGYWVSMMCWLGIYLATTDLRLCNAYSQASQVSTGWGLLLLGLLAGAAWVGNLWRIRTKHAIN